MSLSLSLNNALSGLNVNQRSLSTLSQNIANANNPDYSRKIVTQTSVNLNGIGAGVAIDDIDRTVDAYLQRATYSQTSVVGSASVQSTYAERLQVLLGSPGAGNGLNSYVTTAFNAFQTLAETPESSSNRVNAVNAADRLANEISGIYNEVQELRFQADQEINTSISTVNLRLQELFSLNASITSADVMNRPKSELFDLRDAAIRDISEHVDININERSDGTVDVYARGGSVLLDQSLYQLSYQNLSSADALNVDAPLFSPINVNLVNAQGDTVGSSTPLTTGGTSEEVTTGMQQGRIRSLLDIRDDIMPEVQAQIDMLASRVRDEVNAIHNVGSGFPGSSSLTGTRPTSAGEFSNWQGEVRFGLVDVTGQPLASPWASEVSPMRPLTLDLSTLDSGDGRGPGYPDVQTIVNEFNSHYGVPRNKVSLGSINNIELASTTSQLPGNFLEFDFDLENISGQSAEFFVTSISILDDTNADITSLTSTVPTLALNAASTYTATAGSNSITIAANNHGLAEGDYVFLPTPSSGVGGTPADQLGGLVQVSNVTANGFNISVASEPTSSGTISEGGIGYPKYAESTAGSSARTTANGGFKADLISNLTSSYYTVKASVSTVNEAGDIETSTITYRIANNEGNLHNKRYGASDASGAGIVEVPSQRTQPLATARLVDADGNEIGKINNRYFADEEAFLEIEANGTSSYIAIDSLDSQENGNPNGSPFVVPGTSRGFSHYFEMNNFFTSNNPTSTGDSLRDSAANLAVESRILRNPANVSTGTLVQSTGSGNPADAPLYSYERISGDDSVAQQLADIANQLVTFDSAGGLSATNQTLSGYAGEILGFAGADANSAESSLSSALVILEGFTERANAQSGVNLDEELANTILYQNAYSASARIITVTDELFGELLSTFR